MERAESAFQTGNLPAAAQNYKEALSLSPSTYPALLYLGDIALRTNHAADALDFYRRAHAINPDDYRTLFFQATALRQLGRASESLALLTEALALKPRHPTLLAALLGAPVRLSRFTFQPRAEVVPKADGFFIRVDAKGGAGAAWLTYGACKAMWLGESTHSTNVVGHPRAGWTVDEERECLGNLAVVYLDQRTKPGFVVDDAIERVVQSIDRHLLDAFILYEIASRMDPHVVLQLDAAQRRMVTDYVRSFVAVENK